MRIGLVCPYDLGRPGGVQGQVLGLAEELLRRGQEVAVLGPGRSPGPELPHVTSAGPGRAVRGNGSVAHLAVGPTVPAQVERWLASARPDLVHVHEPATPGLGITAVRRTRAAGLPVVATFHADRPVGRTARASGPVVRRVLGPLALSTAVSPQAWRVAREQYHLDPLVVPNGLDVTAYLPRPGLDPVELRASAGLEGEGPVVLFLGRRDEPRKGLPVLVEALPRLRRLVPEVRVVVAGPGRVRVPEVEDVGTVSEERKRALLRAADVLAAPHTGRESFGIVLAEAMAAGTPVVASALPAFRQVLGEAGVFVPPSDPTALADALGAVLGDGELAGRLRDQGRERVGRWDWAVLGDRWEELYDGAFGARRTGS